MTSQSPDLAAVVERLEKVERQNRRLKTVGDVILALAVAGMVMGQAMPRARIVEAEKFVLKYAAGKVRARLEMVMNGPGLGLYDENGKARAMLGRTELETIKTGTVEQRGESSLVLFDRDGKTIWKAP